MREVKAAALVPAALNLDEGCVALIDRAAQILAGARSAAEVLEARDVAGFAIDAARRSARLLKAKGAHDDLIRAAYHMQADATALQAAAKARLADEYDAAQKRGEVAGPRDGDRRSDAERPTAADIGLTRKQVHEARQIRDAERAKPGVVAEILKARAAQGKEPTIAALRSVFTEAAEHAMRTPERRPAPSRANPLYKPTPDDKAVERIAALAGACERILEKTEGVSRKDLLAGCVVKGMRERTLATLRACRTRLDKLIGDFDA